MVGYPLGTSPLRTGWLPLIPEPITASPDGAMLYDSAGGEPLAMRMVGPMVWQQVVLYRRVPVAEFLDDDAPADVDADLAGLRDVDGVRVVVALALAPQFAVRVGERPGDGHGSSSISDRSGAHSANGASSAMVPGSHSRVMSPVMRSLFVFFWVMMILLRL